MNGAKAASVSSSSTNMSSNSKSTSLRLHLLFSPAPCSLVSYDLKLGGAGVPYVTIAATGTCGAVGEEGAGCVARGVPGGEQQLAAEAGVVRHAPVCVCVGSMMVVMGGSGSPIFALRLGHGVGGFTEVAVGGDSDMMLMLPKGKGGGGNVHVMRWIAAVKLKEQSLPNQVEMMVLIVLLMQQPLLMVVVMLMMLMLMLLLMMMMMMITHSGSAHASAS